MSVVALWWAVQARNLSPANRPSDGSNCNSCRSPNALSLTRCSAPSASRLPIECGLITSYAGTANTSYTPHLIVTVQSSRRRPFPPVAKSLGNGTTKLSFPPCPPSFRDWLHTGGSLRIISATTPVLSTVLFVIFVKQPHILFDRPQDPCFRPLSHYQFVERQQTKIPKRTISRNSVVCTTLVSIVEREKLIVVTVIQEQPIIWYKSLENFERTKTKPISISQLFDSVAKRITWKRPCQLPFIYCYWNHHV